MLLKKIKLNEIEPSEYNPRQISSESYNQIRNSIMNFGLVEPIIINTHSKKIIGGHQRYEVLKRDGVDELYLLELGDISFCLYEKIKLDEKNENILNVALNKISGDWDYIKFSKICKDLSMELDLNCIGIEDRERYYLLDEPSENIIYKEITKKHLLSNKLDIPITSGELHTLSILYKKYVEKNKRRMGFFTYLFDLEDGE